MTRSRGFTLIELMIAVAIIAILAAIAIPSYSDYVRRGRITSAVATLSGMRVKMEQYFQDNRVYNAATPACDLNSIAPLPPDRDMFTYACFPLAQTYRMTATGILGTAMEGFQYQIDENNTRTTLNLPPGWVNLNNNCWVLKRDGSCG